MSRPSLQREWTCVLPLNHCSVAASAARPAGAIDSHAATATPASSNRRRVRTGLIRLRMSAATQSVMGSSLFNGTQGYAGQNPRRWKTAGEFLGGKVGDGVIADLISANSSESSRGSPVKQRCRRKDVFVDDGTRWSQSLASSRRRGRWPSRSRSVVRYDRPTLFRITARWAWLGKTIAGGKQWW